MRPCLKESKSQQDKKPEVVPCNPKAPMIRREVEAKELAPSSEAHSWECSPPSKQQKEPYLDSGRPDVITQSCPLISHHTPVLVCPSLSVPHMHTHNKQM